MQNNAHLCIVYAPKKEGREEVKGILVQNEGKVGLLRNVVPNTLNHRMS